MKALQCIQAFNQAFVHMDVKEDNLVMQENKEDDTLRVFLIDLEGARVVNSKLDLFEYVHSPLQMLQRLNLTAFVNRMYTCDYRNVPLGMVAVFLLAWIRQSMSTAAAKGEFVGDVREDADEAYKWVSWRQRLHLYSDKDLFIVPTEESSVLILV